jgi:hypothetical protein
MLSNGNSHELRPVSEMSHNNKSATTSGRNVTPSPGPMPDEDIIGSWLCDEGNDFAVL